MNGAVMTLSRYYAREAIKRELKSQGIKLQRVESCEITKAANQYIVDHPEIIAFAAERYRSLVASGRLKPPEARNLYKTLEICTATEALICKDFRCANIVNEMEDRNDRRLCPR